MILPAQLAWLVFIAILVLLLIALLEVHRSNERREKEEMYGTHDFEEKAARLHFSTKELHTLEKLVRASSFENKDAVINSSILFEKSVEAFYEFRDVYKVREETLDSVTRIRETMNFTAKNPLSIIYSTRQFSVGDRVDLLLDNGSKLKHSQILWKNEKEWSVSYDGSFGLGSFFIGKEVHVRWTRPEDAVYSIKMKVLRWNPGEVIFRHTSNLEKHQLRRWVRELVDFPVNAVFPDGREEKGVLYDLSAGGILIGLPVNCLCGQHLKIEFELPSFGKENVEIEILRSLGRKNADYPKFFSLTASFAGAFGWTQERVLQYIFETRMHRQSPQMPRKMT